jgi:hypothetical protein
VKRLFISAKIRSLWFLFFALVLQAFLCQSQAASPYTLSHQNSTATIDYQTGGGLTSWTIDGKNQAEKQWFYYRIGGSPGSVSPIETISATPAFSTFFGTRGMTVTYSNATLSVKDSYQLTGNTAGSGKSGLSETISIQNLTASTLTLDFFQFSHLPMADGNQTVSIQPGNGGSPHSAWQTNSFGPTLNNIVTTLLDPIHAEASTDHLTLNAMMTPGFTHLNGNLSASGDVSQAFEWSYIMAPKGDPSGDDSQQISLLMAVVPEPSALALMALGLVGVALHRRRRIQA